LSTARIGASGLEGSDAGAPEGDTHAIAARNELVAHPAAGESPPWQLAQWAARMGATFWSKTGVSTGVARSDEHAPVQKRTDVMPHLQLVAALT
jgi:hypothetical protein